MKKMILLMLLSLSLASCIKTSSCVPDEPKLPVTPSAPVCPEVPEQTNCVPESEVLELLEEAHAVTQSVCDQFESEIKIQFVPQTIKVVSGQWSYVPCDNEVQVTVRKLEKDLVYLHYKVGDDERYSDPLYFVGDKRDRNALFLDDTLQDPVLLYVDTCDTVSCKVSCVQLKVNHLSCFGDGIIKREQ